MVKRIVILFSIILLTAAQIRAAEPADTRTAIFDDSFRTLQTFLNGDDQGIPILALGSEDRLTVSYDRVADDRDYLRYRLIHCDASWLPDLLTAPEYLDGFNEATIDDYAYSDATTQRYVNYSLSLPNSQMAPRLSGNYLLQVYDETDPDHTLLQQRFSILEPQMRVGAGISSRTDIDYNDRHQQLNIALDTRGLVSTGSVYNDVLVEVSQNGREDNKVTLRTPSRVSGDVAYYEHQPSLIFPAGNEYRRMEILSTTFPGMHIAAVDYAYPYYHAQLETDLPRAGQPYSYDETQHGRFRIRSLDAEDSQTGGEYIIVHFSLEMPELQGRDIFVDGDLFQRRFSPESRMTFNRATGRYELLALLKEGAYNYQYLTVPTNGSTRGETATVEGDKYETVNQYLIKVYYRPPGTRYDRLVGVTQVTSGI